MGKARVDGKRLAVYPGTFDPVTYGHIDLIKRALLLFDKVFVAVARNPEKEPTFGAEERVALMRRAVGTLRGAEVESHDGLTVEYAKKKGARIIIRGLRATSDFDYEFQMALTNRQLGKSRDLDTIFLMPSEHLFYLSSRLIKEISGRGGDISRFVPPFVARRLNQELGKA